MSMDGRYKWVFDGRVFAAFAETAQLTHGELAEQHLGQPGAGAEQFERGALTLDNGVVSYEVFFAAEDEPAIEDAIRSWVATLTGHPPTEVHQAPPDCYDFGWEEP